MGMIANVYRQVSTQHADGTATMLDASNKGWSSRFNTVCVVNVPGPFEPNPSQPAVMLRAHPAPKIISVHAVLVAHDEEPRWTMHGGNFLHTSDSRFGEAVRELLSEKAGFGGGRFADYYPGPVPIHDRIEE